MIDDVISAILDGSYKGREEALSDARRAAKRRVEQGAKVRRLDREKHRRKRVRDKAIEAGEPVPAWAEKQPPYSNRGQSRGGGIPGARSKYFRDWADSNRAMGIPDK